MPVLKLNTFAAAAGRLDVGIDPLETAGHQRAGKIQRRAVEKGEALGIDEHVDLAVLEGQHTVFRPGIHVGPFEQVGKPGAATAANAHAQTLGWRRALGRGGFDGLDCFLAHLYCHDDSPGRPRPRCRFAVPGAVPAFCRFCSAGAAWAFRFARTSGTTAISGRAGSTVKIPSRSWCKRAPIFSSTSRRRPTPSRNGTCDRACWRPWRGTGSVRSYL